MEHSNSSKIWELLDSVDFSHGHEQSVWAKIALRLQSGDEALSHGELDDVAGGLSYTQESDNGKEKL